MNKELRLRVYDKCNGHCGYCGRELEYSQMQVDHIEAAWHNLTESQAIQLGVTKGEDVIDNYMPSCARCNRRKGTFSIEGFRNQVEELKARLLRDTPNYSMALDYGIIEEVDKPVVFYFETLLENTESAAMEKITEDGSTEWYCATVGVIDYKCDKQCIECAIYAHTRST